MLLSRFSGIVVLWYLCVPLAMWYSGSLVAQNHCHRAEHRNPKTTATSVMTESPTEGAIDVNNTITKKFADLRPISMERVKGFFPLGKLVTHKSFMIISAPKHLSLTSPTI